MKIFERLTLCHGGIIPHIMGFRTLLVLTQLSSPLAAIKTGVTSVGAML